jgi:F-type H+-transporting ATPase subunit delta
MQNPRLAARYAKSLMDIAMEQSKIDVMYKDMQDLHQLCKENREFVSVLKSPIVKGDTKKSIVKSILESSIDPISSKFIALIISKGREFFLPEIASSFIALYKQKNKINEVTLTTAHPLDDATRKEIELKIAAQFQGMTIDLKTNVDDQLIGGFVVETNNTLFDASILRDLKDIKKQFLNNEYVPNIR